MCTIEELLARLCEQTERLIKLCETVTDDNLDNFKIGGEVVLMTLRTKGTIPVRNLAQVFSANIVDAGLSLLPISPSKRFTVEQILTMFVSEFQRRIRECDDMDILECLIHIPDEVKCKLRAWSNTNGCSWLLNICNSELLNRLGITEQNWSEFFDYIKYHDNQEFIHYILRLKYNHQSNS